MKIIKNGQCVIDCRDMPVNNTQSQPRYDKNKDILFRTINELFALLLELYSKIFANFKSTTKELYEKLYLCQDIELIEDIKYNLSTIYNTIKINKIYDIKLFINYNKLYDVVRNY